MAKGEFTKEEVAEKLWELFPDGISELRWKRAERKLRGAGIITSRATFNRARKLEHPTPSGRVIDGGDF
jgi:hypothetical protein